MIDDWELVDYAKPKRRHPAKKHAWVTITHEGATHVEKCTKCGMLKRWASPGEDYLIDGEWRSYREIGHVPWCIQEAGGKP